MAGGSSRRKKKKRRQKRQRRVGFLRAAVAGVIAFSRPAHCAARELYGLKDPRLPSPYAQPGYDLALRAGTAVASAITGAVWSLTGQNVGAAFLAFRAGKMVDDIATDATAAIGIVAREGLGLVRHLAVGDLWVQQKARLTHECR